MAGNVFQMRETSAGAMINVMRRLFASWGLPEIVISDNSPQFTAQGFEDFLSENGENLLNQHHIT